MGMRICSLSSGSKGNCIFVGTEKSSVLVDAGIPLTKIKKCMEIFGADLSQTDLFVTHTHTDHIKYLSQIARYCKSVYCSPAVAQQIEQYAGYKTKITDCDKTVGDITVSAFGVSHDVPCQGYSFYHGSGKISIATDLGKVDDDVLDALMGSDLVMLESNHDPKMLACNKTYPAYLKKRILSDRGHLCNDACAEAALRLALEGTRQFLLAHLSQENNTPQLAYNTVVGNLEANGIVEGADVSVEVALQDRVTGIYELV